MKRRDWDGSQILFLTGSYRAKQTNTRVKHTGVVNVYRPTCIAGAWSRARLGHHKSFPSRI